METTVMLRSRMLRLVPAMCLLLLGTLFYMHAVSAAPVIDTANHTWTDTFDNNVSDTTLSSVSWDAGGERLYLSSDVANYPGLLGSYDLGLRAEKVYYDGTYAYIGVKNTGLYKLDVSNPASISSAGSTTMEASLQDLWYEGGNIYVPERLYVSASTNNPDPEIGGVEIVDAAGLTYAKYPSDDPTMDLYDYYTFTSDGTYGYAGALDTSSFASVDVMDVSGGTHVGTTSNTIVGYSLYDSVLNNTDYYVSQDTASTNVNGTIYHGMVTNFDVTTAASPSVVSSYWTTSIPYSLAHDGTYLYVGNGTSIEVLNSSMANVGILDTGSEVYGMQSVGTTLYVANGDNGLSVYDTTMPSALSLVGSYANLAGGTAYDVYYDAGEQRAYVADGDAGLMVVSMPAVNLSLQQSYSASEAMDHEVYGNYVYVADGTTGVTIVDVSAGTSTSFGITGMAKGVDIDNGYLYVASDDGSNAIVSSFDLTDPANPSAVDTFTSGNAGSTGNDVVANGGTVYIMGGYSGVEVLRNAPASFAHQADIALPSGFAQRAYLDGNYLYVAAQDGGVHVIDTGTRTVVESYNNNINAPIRDIFISGNYGYLAQGGTMRNLAVIDTTTPTALSSVASIALNTDSRGVAVDGNYAYVVGDQGGNTVFNVVDISTPSAPVQVYRSVPGTGIGESVSSSSGWIYVSSYNRGLDIYGTGFTTSGSAISQVISLPTTNRGWDYLLLDHTLPTSTWLSYDILMPNSNSVIASFNGNTNMYDMRWIDGNMYSDIRLRGNFSTSNPFVTPYLNSWTVKWDPTTVDTVTPSGSGSIVCSSPVIITFTGEMDTDNFDSNLSSYVEIWDNTNSQVNITGTQWNTAGTSVRLNHAAFTAGRHYSVNIYGGVDGNGLPLDVGNTPPLVFEFTPTSCTTSGGGGGGGLPTNTNTNGTANNNTNGTTGGNDNMNNGGIEGGGYVVACANGETPSAPFTDTVDHWGEMFIEELRLRCIISGENGLYYPDRPITRAEFTKIALKGFGIPILGSVAEQPFPDVPTDTWYAPFIETARQKNIVSGYPDGLFRPDQQISRVEALKILLLASGVDLSTTVITQDKMFLDTVATEWYAIYVVYGKEHNVISGYRDAMGNLTGYFGPGNSLTRAETAKIIYRMMEMLGLL